MDRAEGVQHVEHGRIRQGAIRLKAMAFENAKPQPAAALFDLGDQPCLADAGLTGYQCGLASAAPHLIQEMDEHLDVGCPPNQNWTAH